MFEGDVINDIYDYIFENTDKYNINFIRDYPESFVDNANARIYLCDGTGEKFIVKIERA